VPTLSKELFEESPEETQERVISIFMNNILPMRGMGDVYT
jgi:hypothetical protein